MVRLTVRELMQRRGITAYALSRGAGLSYPSAYRLSRPGAGFGRLHADTLDRLPDLRLAVPVDDLVRRPSAFLRGTTSLPVRFTLVRTTGDFS